MKINQWIFVILGILCFNSCVDQEFDIPPGRDVQLEDISTMTIADLKSNYTVGSSDSYTIPEGTIIKGVVVSNDEPGNFFKSMVIQDATAGITISIDATDLYVDYPVGRTVYLRGGLELGDFNQLVQIGVGGTGSEVGRIPEALMDDYFVIGELVEAPTAAVKTLSNLSDSDLSQLIKLENVEVTASQLGESYAFPNNPNPSGQNRIIEDCNGNEIILRNSDFADFNADLMPEGNGSITAVFSKYRDDYQLIIRDTDDLNFTEDRCSGGGGVNGDRISIEDVRAAFANGETVGPDGFVQGIVISDISAGNLIGQNLFLQDGDFGIALRFTDTHTFAMGSEIKVDVAGATMEEFNGLLQVSNIQLSKSSFEGGGNSVTPKELTVAQVLADFENLESTLVKISDATLSGSNTFAGSLTVTDASGQIAMFTRNDAVFSGEGVPTGDISVTAIVSEFNSPQIVMRNRDDVVGGTVTGGGDELALPHTETFDAGLPSGWQSLNTVGNRAWDVRDFDDVFYVNMSAFNSGEILDVVTWLITPEIDFDAQMGETMEIKLADAFENGNPLSIHYSTDFSGSGSPDSATWTQIGATEVEALINNSGTYDNVYESSGEMDLSSITGKGYIAFVYDSNNGSISTTVQISDIILK